ncbi:hypothetical protein FQN49_007322 [Arthroderma sp. PD_2]|nr:hypothetical protein FQN49_007322 [Arthroderma sp. PD_2]
MAQITGLLGPPPKEFIRQKRNGKWEAEKYETILSTSLEDLEVRLEGQHKEVFLKFIRSMLKWLPEDRKTAKALLNGPWSKE